MLNTLLACLFVQLATVSFAPPVVRLGMTPKQVEQILGEPLLRQSDTLGVGAPTLETWTYVGDTVSMENGRVYEVAQHPTK